MAPRGGSAPDAAKMIWDQWALGSMVNEELTGEASGVTLTRTDTGCSKTTSENCEGWRGEWRCDKLLSDKSQFSRDVGGT